MLNVLHSELGNFQGRDELNNFQGRGILLIVFFIVRQGLAVGAGQAVLDIFSSAVFEENVEALT